MTRKKLTALLGAGLALSMAVCLLAGCSKPAQSTATAAAPAALKQGGVIYLKVNPEIAVRYDDKGMVTSLEGRNPDGKEILDGYTGFEGKECKAVIGELVARINEAGYFVEEVEGENRQITLEVARGSSLPADDFLSDIVEQVQTYTAAQQLTSPVEVDGESNYGWTDYADTDYGPDNDGVTDYAESGRSGGAATPATPAPGATGYNDTDYGPNNDGVTDYNDDGDSGYTAPAPAPAPTAAPAPAPDNGDSGYDAPDNGDSGYDTPDDGDSGYDTPDDGDSGYDN